MICPNCKHEFFGKNKVDLFEKHVVRGSGCWGWNGYIHPSGYACFGKNSKLAHRHSYELYKGKIPDGLIIDHLCRNRSCTNPDHLEAVTYKENSIRGLTGMHLAKDKRVINRYRKILAK